jgi:sugar lactone lactonase YvrE
MQKRNIYLVLSLIALFAIIGFMVWDFYAKEQPNDNPYEFKLDNWQNVKEAQISHEEIKQIPVEIDVLRAIAIDNEDQIYISGKDKLMIYSKEGELLKEIPTNQQAFCLFISEEEKLYMASRTEVFVYDLEGNLIETITPEIEKLLITSIVVKDGFLYLADAGNKIMHQCDLQGNLIKEIGGKSEADGIDGFVIPSPYFDLAIGRNGEIWAANTGRHQLESYDEAGRLIYSWKKSSMELDGFSGCCNPSHFAFLSNGSFVTSEKGIERIKIHSPNGEFLSVVAPPTAFEKGTKGIDIAIDSEDRIWTIDPMRSLIRVFAPKE